MSKLRDILGVALSASAVMLTLGTFAAIAVDAANEDPASQSLIERGRYLVKTTGCNDCHTPDYFTTAGDVPEKNWLVGDPVGWRGPWGTTYPVNLRLYMQQITEQEWMAKSKALPARPPMPWFALRDMTDEDRLAIYQYVKSLGAAGQPAPAYLPPDAAPPAPYWQLAIPTK